MPLVRLVRVCAILFSTFAAGGCGTQRPWTTRVEIRSPSSPLPVAKSKNTSLREFPSRNPVETSSLTTSSEAAADIVRVSFEDVPAVDHGRESPATINAADPFMGIGELPLETFIIEVQARNPSLQAAQAAWSAAAQRYPQVIALDDPMFEAMIAPASFGSNSPVDASYTLTATQKVPWHGKRHLRGEMALWEANATAWDTHEVQLRLRLAASLAYFDYYLVLRDLEINRANLTVMEDVRSTAKSKYEASLVSGQDLSLSDLELAKLEQRELELKQAQRVAIARINTLLHRRPDHPLPPITSLLTIGESVGGSELRTLAFQQRPELAALASRIQAEQNAVALACKDYYPDVELLARYDTMWADSEQRGIVGLNLNMPLNRDKRSAAVNEALFRLSRLQAEYAQRSDSVAEEVETTAARLEQARGVAALYEQRILPAAEISLNDAKAAYVSGTLDFQRLLLARRQLADEQLGYQRALADYHRNLAELARAIGSSPELTAQSGPPPAPTKRTE